MLDQTGHLHIPSLIRVFAGQTDHSVGLLIRVLVHF